LKTTLKRNNAELPLIKKLSLSEMYSQENKKTKELFGSFVFLFLLLSLLWLSQNAGYRISSVSAVVKGVSDPSRLQSAGAAGHLDDVEADRTMGQSPGSDIMEGRRADLLLLSSVYRRCGRTANCGRAVLDFGKNERLPFFRYDIDLRAAQTVIALENPDSAFLEARDREVLRKPAELDVIHRDPIPV
jgi:hypothetical protein